MRVKVMFVLAILTIIVPLSFSIPTKNTQPTNTSSVLPDLNSVPSNHQAIITKENDLSNQQTESIRQIIAAEQRKLEQRAKGLSSLTSHDRKLEKSLIDVEEDKFPTLEELRAKCQHFSRLFGLSQTKSPSMERYGSSDLTERHGSTAAPQGLEYYNRPVIEVTRRPVYIRNKPTFIQKNNSGFYVTASSAGNEMTTTKKPYWVSNTSFPSSAYSQTFSSRYTTTTTQNPTPPTSSTTDGSILRVKSTSEKAKIKIKYTKFEPVILQKTILTDGRVLYHWHKSLPTAALDLPAPITPIAAPILPTYDFSPSEVVPAPVLLPTRNFAPIEPVTTEPTTTTTTGKSSWLFVPFSGLFGGSLEESSTVEISTTTPSTTLSTAAHSLDTSSTVKSNYLDLTTEDLKLQQQLKFVVPVHYEDTDANLSSQNRHWDYGRFSSYPKGIRLTNTAVPQSSYQVIKSLAIPQSIPRYSLGYTGSGYGLTFANGLPYSEYGNIYGAGYGNYQGYRNTGLGKDNKKMDDIS